MEEQQEPKPMGDVKPKKDKGKIWQWFYWVVILVLVSALAWTGWQLMESKEQEKTLRKENTQLRDQIDKLKAESATETSKAVAEGGCNNAPTAAMKGNIKAALDTKNTAVFSTYVTNPVKYVLAASEYGGDVSATEAATSLEYTHSATGPWTYVETADYGTGDYGQYFSETTETLKADSGMVVAFDFNCDGKIKQIFVAGDEDLL